MIAQLQNNIQSIKSQRLELEVKIQSCMTLLLLLNEKTGIFMTIG